MNLTLSGRLWAILWWGPWAVASGIYPRPCKYAVFRWWRIGPIEVRRFYHVGEYGRLHPALPTRGETPQ